MVCWLDGAEDGGLHTYQASVPPLSPVLRSLMYICRSYSCHRDTHVSILNTTVSTPMQDVWLVLQH